MCKKLEMDINIEITRILISFDLYNVIDKLVFMTYRRV